MLQALGLEDRQTLYNWVERYETYLRDWPDDHPAAALRDLPTGPQPGQDLTDKQQIVAIGAFLETARSSVLPGGIENEINRRANYDYVHQMVSLVDPDNPVSRSTIARFVRRAYDEHPARFDLARHGEIVVWRDYIPKTGNDTSAPDERWQSDGRYLPIYVQNGDIICRVALVSLIDDFSRYLLDFVLVPRKEKDVRGDIKNVDFTGQHIRLLVANVLYKTGRRTELLCTDNGSQYKALEPRLRHIRENGEQLIRITYSVAGHPWGRGKIEVFGKLVDTFLRDLPGFVEDDDDPLCRRAAQNHPQLLTFEEFEQQLRGYFHHWNTVSENGKPSRYDVWKNTPNVPLPAPSKLDLALLATAESYKKVMPQDLGVEYKGHFYKPKMKDENDYYRWMETVSKKKPIPRIVTRLDGKPVVLISQDGKTWEEAVPNSEQRLSVKKHTQNQRAVINRVKGEVRKDKERFEEILKETLGGKPKIDALTKQLIVPHDTANTAAPVGMSAASEDITTVEPPITLDVAAAAQETPVDEVKLSITQATPSVDDETPSPKNPGITPQSPAQSGTSAKRSQRTGQNKEAGAASQPTPAADEAAPRTSGFMSRFLRRKQASEHEDDE